MTVNSGHSLSFVNNFSRILYPFTLLLLALYIACMFAFSVTNDGDKTCTASAVKYGSLCYIYHPRKLHEPRHIPSPSHSPITHRSSSSSPSSLSPLASSLTRKVFILNLRLGYSANTFLHRPFPFLLGWFHGLSDRLMFLFCSTAGFVCMVCLTKPALSRFSNAFEINALSFIHSFIHSLKNRQVKFVYKGHRARSGSSQKQ